MVYEPMMFNDDTENLMLPNTILFASSPKGGKVQPIKNWKVMQCTGIKDKKGKLIYEGDVIENDNGIFLKVLWNDETASFYQVVCNRKNVENRGYVWDGFRPTTLPISFNHKKIIGNIYEHPDLLDKNSKPKPITSNSL